MLAIEHSAMARYVKKVGKNLHSDKNLDDSRLDKLSGEDGNVVYTGSTHDLQRIKEQNVKFHEKVNKLNRSVNVLSKGMVCLCLATSNLMFY